MPHASEVTAGGADLAIDDMTGVGVVARQRAQVPYQPHDLRADT